MGGRAPIDIDELRSLVGAGRSDAHIAKHFGVSARTILRWRQRYHLVSQWRPPESQGHGVNTRCPCDDCRARRLERSRRRFAERRADRYPAPQGGKAWTLEEDVYALSTRPLEDIARTLGRTYYAVTQRRTLLRRRGTPHFSTSIKE